MNVLYSTQATALGGRDGWAASVDGVLKVKLAKPRALDGAGGGATPEHLFAAAYAASFLEALRAAAPETGSVITDDANVTVTVSIRRPESEDGLTLDVSLALDLPDVDRETAQVLARRAHDLCPYSRALRARLEPRVSIA
ncbi:Ohr family peroxiredoxin [Caulobacter sp. UNC358MFTsu5.1]|uniref:Ohr family peroxiredoxin n=1 Tax=Caulobacter sp. UNC358MFTsu5.1 TaxID=1449049 RepID=UPI0004A71689|nr:Ohr family peroxiredoxin [Caulobacter sp. UNC358MFTsu5.1]